MLHRAYWHYRAVGASFSSFWKSILSGEEDLEEDLEVDFGRSDPLRSGFGILVGWGTGLLTTLGEGSL